MSTQHNPVQGFTDTFVSKLKEQSFTILIMVGVIYYQHRLMEERVAYWKDKLKEIMVSPFNHNSWSKI